MLNFDSELEKLEENLNRDILWRKKELINLKNEIDYKFKFNNQEVSFLIRGTIALVYAHWEGSIKSQLYSYIKFLNVLLKERYIELDNYDNEILDLIFQPAIKTLSHNTKEKRLKGIESFKKLYFNKEILKIDAKEVIDTKSNLSFEVLSKLFDKFKVQQLDNINDKFIEQLLKDRNSIAHGERKYSKNINEDIKKDIENRIEKINNLIEVVENNILEKAQSYKKG